jgi:hypothetical protein
LPQKLIKGNRQANIQIGKESEERFSKKLNRNILQSAAKKRVVDILSEVKTRFEMLVYPKICSGKYDLEQIDEIVFEKIVDPVTGKFSNDPIAPINHEGASDALYYLTGNCHLRWDDLAPVQRLP